MSNNGHTVPTSKGETGSAPQANEAQYFLYKLCISKAKQKPKGGGGEEEEEGRRATEGLTTLWPRMGGPDEDLWM